MGAQPGAVLWRVAPSALRLAASGVALGLPVARILSRWVQSMLFGLTATDASITATAMLLLGTAGLIAAYFPARHAARVDAMTALRHE